MMRRNKEAERAQLKARIMGGAPPNGAHELVDKLNIGGPHTIVAEGSGGWFDLGEQPGLVEAVQAATEHRFDPRLVDCAIKVYRGSRGDRFTLTEVMCLAELA